MKKCTDFFLGLSLGFKKGRNHKKKKGLGLLARIRTGSEPGSTSHYFSIFLPKNIIQKTIVYSIVYMRNQVVENPYILLPYINQSSNNVSINPLSVIRLRLYRIVKCSFN